MRSTVVALLALAGCQSGILGEAPLARGVAMEKIAVYQTVEIPLMEGFDEVSALADPVAGKNAVVRVFVERESGFEARDIKAKLTLDDGERSETLEAELYLEGDSTDGDLESTFNFDVPAEWMTTSTSYSVELRETGGKKGDGSDAQSMWPVEGMADLGAELSAPIEIVLVPIRYNADGSGRLPDTSDNQVARYQELFAALYPATEVVVSVDDPVSWSRSVQPFGQGWDDLLYALMMYRNDANVSPNTYFYGIFEGASSLGSYCEQGCVLGLSTVPGVSDVYGRASIGLGYAGDTAVETAVHEVGHAHGREHAPCGLYGQPSDSGYPHDDAELGVYGYDERSGELIAPDDAVDMMSYCSPLWVSDYTFGELRERIEAVERQDRAMLPVGERGYRAALVRADGSITLKDRVELRQRPTGIARSVEVTDGLGVRTGEATFLPFDHLDGGVLLFPDHAGDVTSIRLR